MSQSKNEIAKQFDLPMRQSKISGLFKTQDVYCICRSTDSTRFMICCDNCEEWFHGDCVNITKADSKLIHSYYCDSCITANPDLQIVYKKKSATPKGGDKRKSKKSEPVPSTSKSSRKVSQGSRCGTCSGCTNTENCKKCQACRKRAQLGSKCPRGQNICRKRICNRGLNLSDDTDDADYSDGGVLRPVNLSEEEDAYVPRGRKGRNVRATKTQKGGKGQKVRGRGGRRANTKEQQQRPPTSESSSEEEVVIQQCYGMGCTLEALPGSKYCSDACGIRLATERIYRVLPSRIQEWSLSPSIAEENNKRELENVRRKQAIARDAIAVLDRRRALLDAHIERVAQMTVDPDISSEEEEDGIVYCVSCGHEISTRNCIKHMERCYNKYESQTSYASLFKTQIEGVPIFCDFYNPALLSYCKRLKVLCPEHTKEKKVTEMEVCGCTVEEELSKPFENRKMCQQPKKRCNKHFSWEKIRRANIDLERVRQWLRLDELMETERQQRAALTNRAGAMALMLHSTFDHELRARIQKQMEEDQRQLNRTMRPESMPNQEIVIRKERERTPTPDIVFEDEMRSEHAVSKKRGHGKSSGGMGGVKKTEEVTASKLYKRMLSSKEAKEKESNKNDRERESKAQDEN